MHIISIACLGDDVVVTNSLNVPQTCLGFEAISHRKILISYKANVPKLNMCNTVVNISVATSSSFLMAQRRH